MSSHGSGDEHTMRGSVVQVKMRLFNALAMVTLWVAQAKESLLQKVVLLIPESKSNVLQAVGVADTCYAILAPSVRSRPSMIVREVTPSVTVL